MTKKGAYILLFLSLLGYILSAFFIERTNFTLLISTYSVLFLIYYFTFKFKHLLELNFLLFSGILFRFSLLFSIPALSDDFYRFIWDGRLQNLGFNPFDYTPKELLNHSKDPFLIELFPLLNSPNYYSVYPSFCQILFKFAAFIGQDNILLNVIVLKSSILLSEIGTIYFLRRLLLIIKKDSSLILLYVLNPLIIIELTGNIHFEAFMISFLLLAILLLYQQKLGASAAALAMAIQAKILPLLFLPLLFKRFGIKKTIFYGFIVLGIILLMSFDLILKPERIQHIYQSLNLYYGKFEFNAGFYLILRNLGWWYLGYNPIAIITKMLLIFSLAAMIYIYLRERSLISGLFWLLSFYLFFAAIVHPWYLTPLIALSIFLKYRFILLWSALIPLTYITYRSIPYQENYWLVGIEYVLVFAYLFWEIKRNKIETNYSS